MASGHRLLSIMPPGRFKIIGVDVDSANLSGARERTAEELQDLGFTVSISNDCLRGSRTRDGNEYQLEVNYLQASIFEESLIDWLRSCEPIAVTAHALMDCLPSDRALRTLHRILPRGALFYTSINYDGMTEFLPRYGDDRIETAILEAYDRSMDERKLEGQFIAGSECGAKI